MMGTSVQVNRLATDTLYNTRCHLGQSGPEYNCFNNESEAKDLQLWEDILGRAGHAHIFGMIL